MYRQSKEFELSFKKITLRNAGDYTCSASNNKGTVESGPIKVIGKIVITLINLKVI